MAELAGWLAAEGHDVVVLTARPHYPSGDGFDGWAGGARDDEYLDGARVLRVPVDLPSGEGLIGRLRRDLRFAIGAGRLLVRQLREAPDAMVIALTPTILALLAIHVVTKVRNDARASVVAITHDIESGLAGKLRIAGSAALVAPMRLLERIALNHAARVFVLSAAMKRELVALGVRDSIIALMPIWAITAVAPPPSGSPPNDAPSGLSVMYSGNLGKKQGLGVLLVLARIMATELPTARLRIQGEGPEKAMLIAGVEALGLHNVDFLPLAASNDLLRSLQAADIHIVPQADDIASYAIPSKLFNIMAAGKPVLAVCETSSPVAEIVTEAGAGLCVPRSCEPSLRDALLSLANDSERRREYGEAGQRYVRVVHDRQTIFNDFARDVLKPWSIQVSN